MAIETQEAHAQFKGRDSVWRQLTFNHSSRRRSDREPRAPIPAKHQYNVLIEYLSETLEKIDKVNVC